jgi:uncharacterized protein (TIGR02246 family)
MKKASLSILAAAVFAAISMSALAADMKAIDAKDKTAIEARMNEFVAAWNKHDSKAMAATWAENGDLVNPFGKTPKGRAEIEKLFAEEQGAAMKSSTYAIQSNTIREIRPGVAVADWEATVTGMTNPEGQALPAFPHRVTVLYVKEGGKWSAEAGRAYGLLPPPGK